MLQDLLGRLTPPWAIAAHISIFTFSLVLLERSVDLFLDSIQDLSRRIGVPVLVLGLLTAGCEYEELATTISALAQQRVDLASGNVFGSAIANILGSFSLGIIFFQRPDKLINFNQTPTRQSSEIIYSTLLVGLSLTIFLIGAFDVQNRILGGCLIASFLVYLVVLSLAILRGFMQQPEDSDSDSDLDDGTSESSGAPSIHSHASVESDLDRLPTESSTLLKIKSTPKPRKTIRKSVLTLSTKFLSGAILLSLAGYLLAYSASHLARLWHINESVFGLTFLSIATTLPEKLLAVYAGRRGEFGILIANTVGSNIFLETINIGSIMLSGQRITYNRVDLAWVFGSAIALWLVVVFRARHRWAGLCLFVGYVAYITLVLATRAKR